jgi:hypothetical protein
VGIDRRQLVQEKRGFIVKRGYRFQAIYRGFPALTKMKRAAAENRSSNVQRSRFTLAGDAADMKSATRLFE